MFVSSCHKFPVKLLKFRTPVQENSDVKCGFLLNWRLFSRAKCMQTRASFHRMIESTENLKRQMKWIPKNVMQLACARTHTIWCNPSTAIHLFEAVMIDFNEFPPFIFISLFVWLTWREIDKLKRVYASHQTNGPFKMKFEIHFGPIECSANTTLNTMCNDIKWNESVCNLFVIDVSRFVCTQHTIECELIQKWQTFQFPFICTRQMFDGSTSQSSSSSSANKHFCGKKTHSSKW